MHGQQSGARGAESLGPVQKGCDAAVLAGRALHPFRALAEHVVVRVEVARQPRTHAPAVKGGGQQRVQRAGHVPCRLCLEVALAPYALVRVGGDATVPGTGAGTGACRAAAAPVDEHWAVADDDDNAGRPYHMVRRSARGRGRARFQARPARPVHVCCTGRRRDVRRLANQSKLRAPRHPFRQRRPARLEEQIPWYGRCGRPARCP